MEESSSTPGHLPHAVDNDSVTSSESQKRLKFGRWTVAVRQYVTTTLFRYVQFVNRDGDIEHGSSIQKIVCKECNIPPLDQIEFWNACGREDVLETLRRKRQGVATAFKTRYAREYHANMDINAVCYCG